MDWQLESKQRNSTKNLKWRGKNGHTVKDLLEVAAYWAVFCFFIQNRFDWFLSFVFIFFARVITLQAQAPQIRFFVFCFPPCVTQIWLLSWFWPLSYVVLNEIWIWFFDVHPQSWDLHRNSWTQVRQRVVTPPCCQPKQPNSDVGFQGDSRLKWVS